MPAVDVTLGSFQFRDFRWVRLREGGGTPDLGQQPHEEAHPAGTGLYMGQGQAGPGRGGGLNVGTMPLQANLFSLLHLM